MGEKEHKIVIIVLGGPPHGPPPEEKELTVKTDGGAPRIGCGEFFCVPLKLFCNNCLVNWFFRKYKS